MTGPIENLDDYCVENEIERLRLRAYNIWPGAVFLEFLPELEIIGGTRSPGIETWVVTEVERFVDTEQLLVKARTLSADYLRVKRFLFNFMEDVSVCGNVVNFSDAFETDDGM